jgi:hypothetical protein
MNRIVVERRVSGEGVLELTLPLGMDEAGSDVRITVEPVGPETPAKEMTPDEWRTRVLATAGGWQGEFVRPE